MIYTIHVNINFHEFIKSYINNIIPIEKNNNPHLAPNYSFNLVAPIRCLFAFSILYKLSVA